MLLVATNVMSFPSRLMSATPSGMVYSSVGRAHRHAGKTRLGNWSVEYAILPKFLDQPGKYLERSTRLGHILAQDAYRRVAPHLFRQRFPDRLRKRHFPLGDFRHRHLAPLLPARDTARLPQTRPLCPFLR